MLNIFFGKLSNIVYPNFGNTLEIKSGGLFNVIILQVFFTVFTYFFYMKKLAAQILQKIFFNIYFFNKFRSIFNKKINKI